MHHAIGVSHVCGTDVIATNRGLCKRHLDGFIYKSECPLGSPKVMRLFVAACLGTGVLISRVSSTDQHF